MSIVFFKDKFIDESDALVSINDRSFRFGDGVFETLLVVNSKIFDFERHLERLKNGLKDFFIDLDVSNLENICTELVAKNQLATGYLRVIVSRGRNGPGSIGYLPRNCEAYLVVQSFEKELADFRELNLWLSSYKAFTKPSSKTNSSANYLLSMLEADRNSCDNALILDHEDYICETASANIFWFKDDILYTPESSLAFVPGTVQEKIMDLYETEIIVGKFKLSDIQDADEVFMTNIGCLLAGIITIKAEKGMIYQSNSDFTKSLALRKKLLDMLLG